MRYDYSRQRLGAMTLRLLAHLAAERGFAGMARRAASPASRSTPPRSRAAWHTALRAGNGAPAEVLRTLERMKVLVSKIRSEKKFNRIVNLGTGGSDLGPRLLADALGDGALDVRFAANVDPHDLERALEGAEPDATLFVVVSKTFTTQETMANAAAARSAGAARHFYAVTANAEAAQAVRRHRNPADVGLGRRPLLGLVGGRLRRGLRHRLRRVSSEFLAGGREIDEHFREPSRSKERAGADGAARRLERRTSSACTTHAVLPYSHRAAPAARLPAAARDGIERQARRPRGPRGRLRHLPGAVGRRGHAQPALVPPAAAPGHAGRCRPISSTSPSNEILSANLRAQADALAFGTGRRDCRAPQHPGNRPSSILFLEKLDAARPRPADRPVRAQGVHAGRALEHQQLRPVGRRAGQAAWRRRSSTGGK